MQTIAAAYMTQVHEQHNNTPSGQEPMARSPLSYTRIELDRGIFVYLFEVTLISTPVQPGKYIHKIRDLWRITSSTSGITPTTKSSTVWLVYLVYARRTACSGTVLTAEA